jgi:hypothetical protein
MQGFPGVREESARMILGSKVAAGGRATARLGMADDKPSDRAAVRVEDALDESAEGFLAAWEEPTPLLSSRFPRCGRLCAVDVRKRALVERGRDMTDSMFRPGVAEVAALGIGMLGDLVCLLIAATTAIEVL